MEEQLSSIENRGKRKRELHDILKAFDFSIKAEYPDVNLDLDDASERILLVYEIILSNVIREMIRKDAKAQIYKVVSGKELACIYVSPYKTGSPLDDVHLNVLLANFVALSFLAQEVYSDVPEFVFQNIESLSILTLEHLDYLKYMSPNSQIEYMPIFSNSTYWRAISFILELSKK
jgi:hypothetical protein